jgi:glycosyltransferase involved in cell wall biosynthesis
LIDLRDPWADPLGTAWEYHPRFGSRIFQALSSFLEGVACRAADGIIANTHHLAEPLAARYPDLPVVRIPNGVDSSDLPPGAPDPYPGMGIAYAGTLYGGRDLGPVVRAFGIFLERHPEAARAGSKLRIAGEAEACHAQALNEAVAAAGIGRHVEVLGSLPRAEALNLVSRSRLAVVLAQGQEMQVPAKLYESVAMGIPTLVVAGRESAAGVEGARVGSAVRDSADVEGIAGVLEQAWCDDVRRRFPCPVPITYEAMAPVVDQMLRSQIASQTSYLTAA